MATLLLVAEEINDDHHRHDRLQICGVGLVDEVALRFEIIAAQQSFCLSSIEDITQLIAYCSAYLAMHKAGELG